MYYLNVISLQYDGTIIIPFIDEENWGTGRLHDLEVKYLNSGSLSQSFTMNNQASSFQTYSCISIPWRAC